MSSGLFYHLTHCILLESSAVIFLDESICHFRGVASVLSLLLYFYCKYILANSEDPDQTPHYVASDLGLHCLPLTRLRVSK